MQREREGEARTGRDGLQGCRQRARGAARSTASGGRPAGRQRAALTDGRLQARLQLLLLLLQLAEKLLGMAADLHRGLRLDVACAQGRVGGTWSARCAARTAAAATAGCGCGSPQAGGLGGRRSLQQPSAALHHPPFLFHPCLIEAASASTVQIIQPPGHARTLNLAPLAAVEAQRLHKAVMLLVRPPLSLLGDGVRLARLRAGAAARATAGVSVSRCGGQASRGQGPGWAPHRPWWPRGAWGQAGEGRWRLQGWARAPKRRGPTCKAPRRRGAPRF